MTESGLRSGSALACALFLGCHGGDDRAAAAHREPPSASIEIAQIDTGVVEDTLEAYGTVEFAEDQQRSLSFVRPGQVMAVSVVEGQVVKKSAELLRVGAVPRGSPEVQQASIAAEFAGRELARVQRLVDEKLATNQDLQNAQKQFAASSATLLALGGEGANAGTAIRASMDGIVAQVLVHRGDVVQVGQTAIMLAARDSMNVRAGFEVEDLPKLSEGLAVRIESAYRGEQDKAADATLSTLHRVVEPKTQFVEGVIRVNAPPAWMAPGLSVRVVVVLEARANVVRVRSGALIQQDGTVGAFVIDNGHASWRALTLGVGGAEVVEVVSGLQKGDHVATTGRTSLTDGLAVRIAATDKP